MKIFSSEFASRIAVAKGLGALFGLTGLVLLPYIFPNSTMMFGWGVFFWYITIGGIIGLMGVMKKHPIFGFRIYPFMRGAVIGGWMCFVFALVAYNDLVGLMQGTSWENCSPFWIVAEGMVVGSIIDILTTKFCGEGKKLLK